MAQLEIWAREETGERGPMATVGTHFPTLRKKLRNDSEPGVELY